MSKEMKDEDLDYSDLGYDIDMELDDFEYVEKSEKTIEQSKKKSIPVIEEEPEDWGTGSRNVPRRKIKMDDALDVGEARRTRVKKDYNIEISRPLQSSRNKQDVILKKKKPVKVVKQITPVEISSEKVLEKSIDREEIQIEKPLVRKDLVLKKSKFYNGKEKVKTWSDEALTGKDDHEVYLKKIGQIEETEEEREEEEEKKNKLSLGAKIKIAGCAIFMVCVLVFIKMNTGQTHYMFAPGKDMYPTIKENSMIKVKTYDGSFDLQRLDKIVLEVNGQKVMSRIIGLPGDIVDVHYYGVFLNDKQIDWELIGGEEYDFYKDIHKSNGDYIFIGTDTFLHYKVPEDSIVVIGDNHMNSLDSIDFGPVSEDLIKGVIQD